MKNKCIIILSTKSAGSSACQNFFALAFGARHVKKTRHYKNETLYWTKAASILGLPQENLLDSEVPIAPKKARQDLLQLLNDNLDQYTPPATDYELIFGGWCQLCFKFAPVFLEKSPHHLYQWSNLELIIECINKFPEIDFHIIGLIRNPMDTLYSAWKRFGTPPEENQHQWSIAYSNLLKLPSLMGPQLSIVRYKDLISDPCALQKVFKFAAVPNEIVSTQYFHQDSVARWKTDRRYGFHLAESVIDLAMQYGYERTELANDDRSFFWNFFARPIHMRTAKK